MARSYRFGGVEVKPSERQLLVEGRPAAVGARAFDVLLALIDHRDRVVTKDELLDMVWPGLVVEENNLQVQVSTLRKILGAQAVATVPGRGYRFTLVPEGVPDAPTCPVPARRHNLPAALNSFVGRDKEIAEIRALLGSSRLVTLSSTGGTGKTRLALQIAAELLPEFSDGAWLVDLAPIADGDRVPQVVAFVLDVKEEPQRPVIETLASWVRDRKLLVVLDNCEHVLKECAGLAKRLLVAGAGVKIVATSRERLGITGETNYPLPALSLPGPDALAPAELGRSESVQLFLDRATASLPSFRLNERNAASVAEICRKLDGIPLAIELAAARVHALAPDEIATHLDECFRVLTGGDVTALPRQQTLRASIDWSYELLAIPERLLFRRLAVFAGGWTVDAAEAVGAGGDVEAAGMLELLSRLVQKSLVTLDTAGARYRLLETMRQYARELLDTSGEQEAVRNRHLDFYLQLAEHARPELVGPRQGAWLSRLDVERENLLSAHAWCDHAPGGAAKGLQLSSALKPYWGNRGQLALGHRITIEALARSGAQERSLERCRGLFDAGQLAAFMGRYAEAQRDLEESLAIAQELGDRTRIAVALQPLGMACLGQRNVAKARAHLENALALARDLGSKREVAAAMNNLAQVYRVEGDLDAAEPLYDQALALARELGDSQTVAIGLLNLAMVAVGRGQDERARLMLVDVLSIAAQIGSRPAGQSVLEVCAGLATVRNDHERAAHFYGTAEALAAQTGLHRAPADDAFLEPLVANARKALDAKAFEAAEAAGRALSYDEATQEARAWLAASRS